MCFFYQADGKVLEIMKKDIHPDYKIVTVSCACGHSFQTYSQKEETKLDICAKCHPFYSGEEKILDSAGRVDRFKRRYQNMS